MTVNDGQVESDTLLVNKPQVPVRKDNALIGGLRSCCIIPQRYMLGLIGLFGTCNAYTMRVCLNMAITQMVNISHVGVTQVVDPDACPSQVITNSTAVVLKPYAIYDWDEKSQGLILSGFYYGYAATQFLGGLLSERYGGKWILGLGLLSTALFTLLTPFVIRTGGSTWLFILRILEGMGEGPTMPGLIAMMSKWIPPHERSIQGAFIFGGSQIGNIVGTTMSGVLLSDGKDWAYVFYFFGALGIVWFILWSLLCYSTPESHPYISEKELKYLKATVITAKHGGVKDPVPWKAMIRSTSVWALALAAIGHDWGYYTVVSDLPKYSHDVLKYNIATTGILTALPYIAMWISSFLFGYICDESIKRGWHSIKTGRMIYTTVSSLGPAVGIILASYAGCDGTIAMIYFVISMGLMGGFYSGMKVNALDLSANFSGSLTSFVNTLSTMTGILVPYLIGILTPDSTLMQWRKAFWMNFAVLVGTNIGYCIWADGKQQWWDDVRQYGYPAGWKHGPLINEKIPDELNTVDLKEQKIDANI